MSDDPPVLILCGGRGTRLRERTAEIPKPLVEIGGMPILWHVIRLHAAQGLRRFVLLTGYRGAMIERFVADASWPEPIEIDCIDTGPETGTGGRISIGVASVGRRRLCCAYGDGLADIDLGALVRHHGDRGGLATMAVVRPRSQFGVAELDAGDRVRGFEEKPRMEQWVNAGFFCFEPDALDYLDGDGPLEGEPLRRLAAEGNLRAYRHHGFWDCMDTYKDAVVLNDLWARGDAPWAVWERAPLVPGASDG